jgi:hypothetical protein
MSTDLNRGSRHPQTPAVRRWTQGRPNDTYLRVDNDIVTIVDGAGVRSGPVDERVDHYRLLRTLEAMYGLAPLGRAAATEPISDIWTRSDGALQQLG